MIGKVYADTQVNNKSNRITTVVISNDEILLKYYLGLDETDRAQKFAPPSTACKIVGRSPRTIQRWIEAGHIRAVYIVGRYQVEIISLKAFALKEYQSHVAN